MSVSGPCMLGALLCTHPKLGRVTRLTRDRINLKSAAGKLREPDRLLSLIVTKK